MKIQAYFVHVLSCLLLPLPHVLDAEVWLFLALCEFNRGTPLRDLLRANL